MPPYRAPRSSGCRQFLGVFPGTPPKRRDTPRRGPVLPDQGAAVGAPPVELKNSGTHGASAAATLKGRTNQFVKAKVDRMADQIRDPLHGTEVRLDRRSRRTERFIGFPPG